MELDYGVELRDQRNMFAPPCWRPCPYTPGPLWDKTPDSADMENDWWTLPWDSVSEVYSLSAGNWKICC